MIETRGRIVAIAGGMAEVQLANAGVSACGSCRARSACGGDSRLVRVAATPAMRAGAEVALCMPEGALAAGAVLGYLMPAAALVAGAVAGAGLVGSDAAAAAGAGLGLAAGLLALRLAGRLISRKRLHPVLCRPVSDSSTGD